MGKDIKIVAVTACPTGIAHTYMAAEKLEQTAKDLGYTLKCETNGSGGAKNVLTAEDIAEADGVIIAADITINLARFDGKPVLQTKVADGIHKADELINKIVNNEVPVYTHKGSKTENAPKKKGGVYGHLMNGVSHMLPFVIGGGILKAIAFLIDTICGYGATGGGNFGSCTPLSSFFMYSGGLIMDLMIPVLAGYIAYSIAQRPGLAVGFAGGLLAANGNSLVANAPWADSFNNGTLGGFQQFIANFGFVSSDGVNTVSGFLGALLAGFLAGYIVLGLERLCEKLPKALDGIKPMLIYPVCGIFILSVLMIFIFNPIIGWINTMLSTGLTALADMNLIVVLGIILGAMMAIDMGGPINKAAYLFGTGVLATATTMLNSGASLTDPAVQSCYISMASIMVGGMVPPLGIALACIFFKNKFTKEERSTTITNIVMGCSFITEGAIPFAASDPLHVIPCTLVGAGVAGGLSAAFGCTLMAPHGGIFVFATVGNPLLYILSWLIGSVITAVLLGLIKKPVKE
jgi:PTS system fructose-specific IIC component